MRGARRPQSARSSCAGRHPATIGNGVVWTWNPGEELIVPVSSYLAFWNFGAATGSVLNMYVKWIE